ncbi:hypothetical protein Angca_006340, partial [Angiostrongylus cantonensis]
WYAAGLIRKSFLKLGEPITVEQYCQQIDEMHRKFQQERQALYNRKGPILLHDDNLPHAAELALQGLNDLG